MKRLFALSILIFNLCFFLPTAYAASDTGPCTKPEDCTSGFCDYVTVGVSSCRAPAVSTPKASGACSVLNAGKDCASGICQNGVCAPVVTNPGGGVATINMSTFNMCTDGSKGVQTAIGCIHTDFGSGAFIKDILTAAVGIGGGFALLLIMYAVFIITTSAGIPDKLKQGQEILTGAITGLVFIVLSLVLMNLIGVQILQLPGL